MTSIPFRSHCRGRKRSRLSSPFTGTSGNGTLGPSHDRLSQLTPEDRQLVLTETCPTYTRQLHEVLIQARLYKLKCGVYLEGSDGTSTFRVQTCELTFKGAYY